MASFIRQLNMCKCIFIVFNPDMYYRLSIIFRIFLPQFLTDGFRKVSNIEHGGLKSDGDEVEFFHHHFCLGQENQLELIKRKVL